MAAAGLNFGIQEPFDMAAIRTSKCVCRLIEPIKFQKRHSRRV